VTYPATIALHKMSGPRHVLYYLIGLPILSMLPSDENVWRPLP